ncbi:hypothetical protein, partial [Nocardioides sp. GCM10030258]|uniref:hypothetical protein n=1 Tax=unclassified Nocardioides TaxID=2615069 RepID=UPI0036069DEE
MGFVTAELGFVTPELGFVTIESVFVAVESGVSVDSSRGATGALGRSAGTSTGAVVRTGTSGAACSGACGTFVAEVPVLGPGYAAWPGRGCVGLGVGTSGPGVTNPKSGVT